MLDDHAWMLVMDLIFAMLIALAVGMACKLFG